MNIVPSDLMPAPPWWHPHGFDAKVVEKPLSNNREITHTTGACHANIFKLDKPDSYELVTHAFLWAGDFRSDLKRPMSGSMFAYAYDLLRDDNIPGATDPQYAARFHADFGIPGIYLRKGPYLILGGVGHGLETDPFPCIFLFDFIRKDAQKLRSLIIT